MSQPTLADALAQGRNNNLDAVRLAAAFAVLCSHAVPLSQGAGATEPLETLTGRSLGGWAVLAFFVLSGLLVTRSALRGTPAIAFAAARARRVLPGLAGVLVTTAVLALATGGGQTSAADGLRYVVRGLSLAGIEHRLHGLFEGNPLEGIANGSLWTLFYEAAAYAVVGVLLLAHRAFGRRGFVLMAIAAVVGAAMTLACDAAAYRLATGAPLFLAFALGGLCALAARRIRPGAWLLAAAATVAVAVNGTVFQPAGDSVLVAALVLWLGFCAPRARVTADISYGVYLYGWPVAQAVLWLNGPMSAQALALASALAVLPFAVASFVLLERPALCRARQAAGARPALYCRGVRLPAGSRGA